MRKMAKSPKVQDKNLLLSSKVTTSLSLTTEGQTDDDKSPLKGRKEGGREHFRHQLRDFGYRGYNSFPPRAGNTGKSARFQTSFDPALAQVPSASPWELKGKRAWKNVVDGPADSAKYVETLAAGCHTSGQKSTLVWKREETKREERRRRRDMVRGGNTGNNYEIIHSRQTTKMRSSRLFQLI